MKKGKPKWALLEHFEAPMWVDLTKESNCYNQDKDDDWFNTSHHEESSTSEFDSEDASSSEAPLSVSRSRGKDYKSKKWKGDDHNASINKQQQSFKALLGETSCSDIRCSEETKSKLGFVKVKGTSPSNTTLVNNPKAKNVKQVYPLRGSESCLTSIVDMADADVATTTCTVTSDKVKQQHDKFLEVSDKAVATPSREILSVVTSGNNNHRQKNVLDVSSGQLPDVKSSLRKGYASRPESRVEIHNSRKSSTLENSDESGKTNHKKSSSRKSSVGSSSNPSDDYKGSTVMSRHKEQNTGCRNVVRMNEAAKIRVKAPMMSKASTTKNVERKGSIHNGAQSAHSEATSSKSIHPKSSLLLDEKSSSTLKKATEKVKGSRGNSMLGVDKENAAGRRSTSQT